MEKRTTLRILYSLYVVLAALHILIHAGDLYRGNGVWQVCSKSNTQCRSTSSLIEEVFQSLTTLSTLSLALGVLLTLAMARRYRFKYYYYIDVFLEVSGFLILALGFAVAITMDNFGAAFYAMWITGVLAFSSYFIIKQLKPESPEQAAPEPEPEDAEADGEEAVEVPPAAAGDLGAPSAGNVAMDVLPPRNE